MILERYIKVRKEIKEFIIEYDRNIKLRK